MPYISENNKYTNSQSLAMLIILVIDRNKLFLKYFGILCL